MNRLIDTHLLIWSLSSPERPSREAAEILADRQGGFFFSYASLWEISIKAGLRRPDFQIDPAAFHLQLLRNGYNELPIRPDHMRSRCRTCRSTIAIRSTVCYSPRPSSNE